MKKFFAWVTVIVTVLSLNFTMTQAAQWDFLIDMPPYSTYYIESSSVFCDELRDNEVIFHAFLKSVYTDEGRRKVLKRFRDDYGYLPDGATKITHSIFLEYFKWSKGVKYYTIDSETICQADGTIVRELSSRRSFHDWKVIVPGTISDTLFDLVGSILANRTAHR